MFYGRAIALFPLEEAAMGIPVGLPAGIPVGGAASTFNIGGAPIAILGGVFAGGLPLAGPVTQIFRGGGAPIPPTLFVSTISPAGPIGEFFVGAGGAPLGVPVFMGGGLPIGAPPAVAQVEAGLQPRTALVGATLGLVPPPAIVIGGMAAGGAPIGGGGFAGPIGGGAFGGMGGGGTPIGR